MNGDGRLAIPCSGCGRATAYVSAAVIENAAQHVPLFAVMALRARFIMGKEPDAAIRKASDFAMVRCPECERITGAIPAPALVR